MRPSSTSSPALPGSALGRRRWSSAPRHDSELPGAGTSAARVVAERGERAA